MKLFTKTMKHPEYPHLQIVFEAEEEFDCPTGHFDHKEDIDFAQNNEAGWFVATVKVELVGTSLFGMDSLGCCSYETFEDFLEDEYFHDMVENATHDLISDLNDTTDRINEFSIEYNKTA